MSFAISERRALRDRRAAELLHDPSGLILLLAESVTSEAKVGIVPLQPQQLILGFESSGKTRQLAVGPEDSVTRRDNRNRIAAVRGADRT
jgi:hypothetical protein